MKTEKHYTTRSGWLRAAILGANDGIISTASIVIGVAAAVDMREDIILTGIAGMVAGSLSMAAGEYVSVSSQADLEEADLQREIKELKETPEMELDELHKIYVSRGLNPALALEVAKQLTAYNALETHARDELGINEITKAKPLQAALASGAAFIFGALLPVMVAYIAPMSEMVYIQYATSLVFLIILGMLAARAGGSSIPKAVLRISFWGTIAMGISAMIGYLFGLANV